MLHHTTQPCIVTFLCVSWIVHQGTKVTCQHVLQIFRFLYFVVLIYIMYECNFSLIFDSEEKGILDESDHFLMDLVGFTMEYAKNWSSPSHIVPFDSQEKLLKEFLVSLNFHEVNFEFF